eukprot:6203375-Pleurochrysis_carterae.AAC.6
MEFDHKKGSTTKQELFVLNYLTLHTGCFSRSCNDVSYARRTNASIPHGPFTRAWLLKPKSRSHDARYHSAGSRAPAPAGGAARAAARANGASAHHDWRGGGDAVLSQRAVELLLESRRVEQLERARHPAYDRAAQIEVLLKRKDNRRAVTTDAPTLAARGAATVAAARVTALRGPFLCALRHSLSTGDAVVRVAVVAVDVAVDVAVNVVVRNFVEAAVDASVAESRGEQPSPPRAQPLALGQIDQQLLHHEPRARRLLALAALTRPLASQLGRHGRSSGRRAAKRVGRRAGQRAGRRVADDARGDRRPRRRGQCVCRRDGSVRASVVAAAVALGFRFFRGACSAERLAIALTSPIRRRRGGCAPKMAVARSRRSGGCLNWRTERTRIRAERACSARRRHALQFSGVHTGGCS